jgi:CheY-like chemotaxis protein
VWPPGMGGRGGDPMPYKLLLADDSVTIRRVIELTFADEEVLVAAVGDGQQAIDRIVADRPDIVLADVDMPGRDGYEVAAFVKNDPSLQHIPVLLLTGAFEPVDDERVRSVRCDGVLAKPFEPQLLISRVKELLRGVAMSPIALVEAPAIVEPAAQPAEDAEGGDVAADLRLDVDALRGVQSPAPAADGTLDDYFDRLDAAFAHLTGAQPGRDATTPARPKAADPWAAAVPSTPDWPRPAVAAPQPDGTSDAGPSARDAANAAEAAAAVAVPVADAFAALLAAEREHGADVVHRGDVRSAATVMLPGTAATQAFIETVARRVLEQLGEPAFRDVIPEIVSATAERLIREEIARVKNLAI